MKTLILSILLFFVVGNISAQENLPYKPLSEFGTDTAAFLKYNFIDRENYYIGKTLNEVITDLQLPINDIFFGFGYRKKSHLLYHISLRILDKQRTDRIIFNSINEIYGIAVEWEIPIEKDDKIKAIADARLMDQDWDIDAALDYLKTFDNKVSEITLTNISDNKYYSRHRKESDNNYPIIKSVGDTLYIAKD